MDSWIILIDFELYANHLLWTNYSQKRFPSKPKLPPESGLPDNIHYVEIR